MTGEKNTTAKSPKTKAEKVEEKVEQNDSLVENPVIEIVEVVVPNPEPEDTDTFDLEDDFVNFSDVEALSRRGRRSKADIEILKQNARRGLETFYGNLINNEPAKADMFRQQLIFELKSRGLF